MYIEEFTVTQSVEFSKLVISGTIVGGALADKHGNLLGSDLPESMVTFEREGANITATLRVMPYGGITTMELKAYTFRAEYDLNLTADCTRLTEVKLVDGSTGIVRECVTF